MTKYPEQRAVDAESVTAPASTIRHAQGPRRDWSGPLFMVPAIVLIGFVVYYAIAYTIYTSTLDWNGLTPEATSVGLQNYIKLFNDPVFWESLRHMVIYGLAIPVNMFLGLLFAVLLHTHTVRFKVVYKVIIFIPVILAPAVMAPVFREMLSPDGEVNMLLDTLGLGRFAHAWLADPSTALPALMVIFVWNWTGINFLIYYAGLTVLDPSVFEAARVDGAGNARIFVSLIIPMTKGSSYTLLALSLIGLLKTFDVPYLVTGGGPAHTTEFLGTYLYSQSITNFKIGYGSALTIVMIVLSLVLTVWQLRRYRTAGVV
ncbi:MAG: carbohydrate ABC transporter permease [Candidatus Dormibacteraceae bacterium]